MAKRIFFYRRPDYLMVGVILFGCAIHFPLRKVLRPIKLWREIKRAQLRGTGVLLNQPATGE